MSVDNGQEHVLERSHPPRTEVIAADAHNLVTQERTSSAAPPQAVMSWVGAASSLPDEVDSVPAGSTAPPAPAFADLPPSYDTARVPTEPIKYTFSPQSFNTMLLVPPPDVQDTRPLYHISVALNCFIPSSFVTTIRRGASEYGEYVGEFEMGNVEAGATATIDGKGQSIGQRMTRNVRRYGVTSHLWIVKESNYTEQIPLPLRIRWEVVSAMKMKCWSEPRSGYARSDANPQLLAIFEVPLLQSIASRRFGPATLTIHPPAYCQRGLLDHVILSVLISERIRLTPKVKIV